MNQLLHTTDFRSNLNDQMVYAAKQIGRSKHKKLVFKAVYFGKKKIKTVHEIASSIGLSRKRVLEEARKLVTAKLIHQTKHKNDTAYEKDDAYKGVWKKILNLAGNKKKIEKIPTKVKPLIGRAKCIIFKVPKNRVQIKQITIDDIDSFYKVRTFQTPKGNFTAISESIFKKGILKIIGETNKPPSDWGGEKNDIFTTRLKIKSKRLHAAIALKGPGQRITRLTPRHLGKNGDQINRLMTSSAQVFIVQYWKEIDQSVVDLLQQLSIAKSYSEGRVIYFGIIDGQDSNRLLKTYQSKFK